MKKTVVVTDSSATVPADLARELDIRVVPIAEQHIEGFHQCLDSVARERRYLGFLEAPPLESTRQFVQSNIASGVPQFVALDGERVVGWCDISPSRRQGFAHCGELGMGCTRPTVAERTKCRTPDARRPV